MRKQINLSKTIYSVTDNRKEGKQIHQRVCYLGRLEEGNPQKITLNSSPLHVDEMAFYDLIKKQFSHLKQNIPDQFKLSRVTVELNQSYDLVTGPQTPTFTTIEEAAEIIQQQAERIFELELKNTALTKRFEEARIKSEKWDSWIAKKGHSKKS